MNTRTRHTAARAARLTERISFGFLMQSALLTGLLLIAGHAGAIEFNQVVMNESAITFGYRQMGVSMDGKFGKYAARLAFDPAKPAQAQASFDIDVASIDAGSADANDEVVGKLWFNAAAYPTASFVSTSMKALGGNRYEASGKLSIKGRTLDVTALVTFQATGKRGVFTGAFTIKRLDYGIGEGIWADVSAVENAVQIKFNVVVIASSSKK